MSRGHGRVQRAVLAVLARQPGPHMDAAGGWNYGWTTVEAITDEIHGGHTRAQLESVRRAIKSLAGEGLAQITHWNASGTRTMPVRLSRLPEEQLREYLWGRLDRSELPIEIRPVYEYALVARRPLTMEEQAAENEAEAARDRRIAELMRALRA